MSKYDALRRYFESQTMAEVVMEFKDIEKILGSNLPPSARMYRAWWSNERGGSHIHCRSWMDVGYVVDQVDSVRERVIFRRKYR